MISNPTLEVTSMEAAEKTIASTDEVGAVSMSPSTSLLASYLVRCELVFPEAVEDPEGFDGGVTMARIYALGRVLFHGEEDLFLSDANAALKSADEGGVH
jgi:hypothetical protein